MSSMSNLAIDKDQVIEVLNGIKDLEWTELDLKDVIYMVGMNTRNKGEELSLEEMQRVATTYFEIKARPAELVMTDEMLERNDDLENATREFIGVLIEGVEDEFELQVIYDVLESAKEALKLHGIIVRHPSIIDDGDGVQMFDDETEVD